MHMQKNIQQNGPFDEEFDPPYTTLHSGVIKGGTVNNIIPNHCQFDFEIRNLPDQPTLPLFHEVENYAKDELIPDMKKVAQETDVEWSTLADYPGMNTPEDEPLIAAMSELLGTSSRSGKVSYGTEGGHFQQSGISTIVCGPGSIEQAHKPNEYIDLDQMAQGEKFISALISSLD